MNIIITGRHINVSDSLREYSEKKIKKLENHFNQLIDAHVIMFSEKHDRIAEVIINGDGVQFHGREKAADFYSAIDLLFDKMDKQVTRYKEKHQAHKGPDKTMISSYDYDIEEGKQVMLNQVSNKPIDRVEAFLQMNNSKSDFMLFKLGVGQVESDLDYANKNYAVLYRDNETVKLVEIPYNRIKENRFDKGSFVEYILDVKDDSPSHPKIDFKQGNGSSINNCTITEAVDWIEKSGGKFLPFFNSESQYLNIIYRDGDDLRVMVPAF